jgi:hypothetical protein
MTSSVVVPHPTVEPSHVSEPVSPHVTVPPHVYVPPIHGSTSTTVSAQPDDSSDGLIIGGLFVVTLLAILVLIWLWRKI